MSVNFLFLSFSLLTIIITHNLNASCSFNSIFVLAVPVSEASEPVASEIDKDVDVGNGSTSESDGKRLQLHFI